jgi:hypothetical protein
LALEKSNALTCGSPNANRNRLGGGSVSPPFYHLIIWVFLRQSEKTQRKSPAEAGQNR